MINSVITGTGAYIPENVKKNEDFLSHIFYTARHSKIDTTVQNIIQKFGEITGIRQRVYADPEISASDMAIMAAKEAIRCSGVDIEKIDYIIVAHNYGDRSAGSRSGDNVPSLASRVKHHLGIKNSMCIPYDLIFGCPGWLQAVIQADLYIKSGNAHTCLVIGADTLSRVIDPSDRDCMLFSDGAGACILQSKEGISEKGILTSSVRSDTSDELDFIYSGPSNIPDDKDALYLKMKGQKVYQYAVSRVPGAMKDCFDKTGIPIHKLKMIFLHQANEKMDAAIVREFYKLYGTEKLPENVMPMNIGWIGNNSVATIPILLHQVITRQLPGFFLQQGDVIMLASVGAGMNINTVVYEY